SVLASQALAPGDPEAHAMVGSQAVGHLWVREVGPLDGGVPGCASRGLLEHVEKSRVPSGDDLIARLTAAACPTEAWWLESVGSRACLPPWREGRAVTAQHTRHITGAAVVELARCDGGIPATGLC